MPANGQRRADDERAQQRHHDHENHETDRHAGAPESKRHGVIVRRCAVVYAAARTGAAQVAHRVARPASSPWPAAQCGPPAAGRGKRRVRSASRGERSDLGCAATL